MSKRTVPLHKTPGFFEDRGEIVDLGPLPIDLPGGDGRHVGQQFLTSTTMHAEHRTGMYVVLFLGKPVAPELKGLGAYFALDPASARGLAAAIIQSANMIDGGDSKQ